MRLFVSFELDIQAPQFFGGFLVFLQGFRELEECIHLRVPRLLQHVLEEGRVWRVHLDGIGLDAVGPGVDEYLSELVSAFWLRLHGYFALLDAEGVLEAF